MNTNVHLARKGDITEPRAGSKYLKSGDRELADKPIAYSPEGKRIFAYNEKGQPICFSKVHQHKTDPITGELMRCRRTETKVNGRCRFHGGNNHAGINHYNAKHLRSASNLPGHLAVDFRQAMNDPDIFDLKHEIGLVDIQIAQLKRSYNTFVGGTPSMMLKKRLDSLEYKLDNSEEITEDMLRDVIEVYRRGINNLKVDAEINSRAELRRKLAETGHRRECDLNTMIRADQAIALVTGVAAFCKESIQLFCDSLIKKYVMIPRDQLIGLDSDLKNKLKELETQEIDRASILNFAQNIVIKLGSLISKPREIVDPVTQGHPLSNGRLKEIAAPGREGKGLRKKLGLPEPITITITD